jgi:hypothetical protein
MAVDAVPAAHPACVRARACTQKQQTGVCSQACLQIKDAEEVVRSGRVITGRARGTDASRFVRGTTDARKLASLALYAHVRRRRTALVLSMVRASRTIETHAFVVCANDAGILASRTIEAGALVGSRRGGRIFTSTAVSAVGGTFACLVLPSEASSARGTNSRVSRIAQTLCGSRI